MPQKDFQVMKNVATSLIAIDVATGNKSMTFPLMNLILTFFNEIFFIKMLQLYPSTQHNF